MQKISIKLKDIEIFGYHGLYEYEKENGQVFQISISIDYLPIKNDDDIKNYIDYVQLYEFVKNKFIEKRFNLLEKLIDFLSKQIADSYKQINKIKISIKKPGLSIGKNKNCVLVEKTFNLKWFFWA